MLLLGPLINVNHLMKLLLSLGCAGYSAVAPSRIFKGNLL